MDDVKWIKVNVNMFDNRKIKYIRKLPEGNNIVLIWIMLLTMAGRCNSGGMIFLTENIPYTTKTLADELEFEESVVLLALKTMEKLGMISTNPEDFLSIKNWGEHQNIEGMEKIREQARIRAARYRENQKQLGAGEEVPEPSDGQGPSPSELPGKKLKYSEKFEEFWNVYPLKKDKGAAYKQFCARINQGENPDDMILAAKEYARECRRNRTESRYIKHGTTFLGNTLVFREYLPVKPALPAETMAPDMSNPFAEYANKR